MPELVKPPSPEPDPGAASVRKYLLYTLSLPERTLRSGAGMVGGALRESAGLLVPQAFQSSKTYAVLIRQTLDFLAEDIGGVANGKAEAGPPRVENFVARKAVGNFLEMAGLATLHLSPLMVLAIVSDVAYGSRAYVGELAKELKRQGVIDQDSTIDRVDDLLDAVAKASSVTASAFDTPPLSVDGLKHTVEQTRQAVASIDPAALIPQAEITRLWDEMHELAAREETDLMAISSTVTLHALGKIATVGRGALSTVTVAGTLVDRCVIVHYREALGDIRRKGLYATLAETSGP